MLANCLTVYKSNYAVKFQAYLSSFFVNEIFQNGPIEGLDVRGADGAKGLGVFSTKQISKGEFVCEYAGEIIGESEAENRNEVSASFYLHCT